MFFYKYVLFSYILQNIGLIKRLPIPQQEFLQFIELREYSINCIGICYTHQRNKLQVAKQQFHFFHKTLHTLNNDRLLE